MSDFNISDELKKVPETAGVYMMRDVDGTIIYIGKAKNLRKRISQYFTSAKKHGPKIDRMVKLIAYFEYIMTDSEVEALILENNLIKEHHPRYNTLLKDDKTYPYIRLSVQEPYPRLSLTRKIKKDKSKYFGPYPDAAACREIIDLLNRTYRLRTCNLILPRDAGKRRPCLNSHIGRCSAPCVNNISEEEYLAGVREVVRFLGGSYEGLRSSLRAKMKEASDCMEYEKAAEYKALLEASEKIFRTQKMEVLNAQSRDILGFARLRFDSVIQIFFIRGGKLIGREHFRMSLAPDENDREIISSFIKQYYSESPFIPPQILVPIEIDDAQTISAWLSEKSGRAIKISIPKRGNSERMTELASRNAKLILDNTFEKAKLEELRTKGAAEELSKILGIPYAKRIESYDISNISGQDSVASMVVYEDGKPKKTDYRKFRIKTVEGANDPASMAEVISRRFTHQAEKKVSEESVDSFAKVPDLLLIDGGKTQVNAVRAVLNNLGIDIPVCGMVKDDRHRTRGFLFNNSEIITDKSKEPFKLVTRIQDETHRFAIEYHKKLRGKAQIRSILDDIEGIGPKRRLSIMRYFKSLDAVKEASVEELKSVPGMNIKAARAVKDYFDGTELK